MGATGGTRSLKLGHPPLVGGPCRRKNSSGPGSKSTHSGRNAHRTVDPPSARLPPKKWYPVRGKGGVTNGGWRRADGGWRSTVFNREKTTKPCPLQNALAGRQTADRQRQGWHAQVVGHNSTFKSELQPDNTFSNWRCSVPPESLLPIDLRKPCTQVRASPYYLYCSRSFHGASGTRRFAWPSFFPLLAPDHSTRNMRFLSSGAGAGLGGGGLGSRGICLPNGLPNGQECGWHTHLD